jgi:hypothetical protein
MGVIFNNVAANNVDLLAGRNFLRNVAGGTLMGWATLNALGTSRSLIAVSIGTGTGTRAKMTCTTGNGLEIRIRVLDADASSVAFATPGSELNTSGRFHLAATINFSNVTGALYINGQLITTGVFTGLTGSNTSNTASLTATLGANETGASAPWFGEVEDCRIYGRFLGPAEIATIYAARGSDGIVDGLEGRWCLNDGPEGVAATVLADLSSNGYSGAASGTLTFAGSTLRTGRFQKVTGRS